MLSAVVITHNEARNIARCLDSLTGVADEVVVLDSFSDDDTPAICRARGVRFEQHVFDGYLEQKNRANALASNDLIFSIDADEALSDALRASILAIKNQPAPPHQAYSMNRLTNYCGQWVRHSGWYPDRKIRLFDRRYAAWGGGNPHETLELSPGSTAGHLQGDLLHYSYYSVQEHLDRTRHYSRMAATALAAQGKRSSWFKVWLSPMVKFLRNYVLKLGVLDGATGFTICRISALETHWRYRTLRELNRPQA